MKSDNIGTYNQKEHPVPPYDESGNQAFVESEKPVGLDDAANRVRDRGLGRDAAEGNDYDSRLRSILNRTLQERSLSKQTPPPPPIRHLSPDKIEGVRDGGASHTGKRPGKETLNRLQLRAAGMSKENLGDGVKNKQKKKTRKRREAVSLHEEHSDPPGTLLETS